MMWTRLRSAVRRLGDRGVTTVELGIIIAFVGLAAIGGFIAIRNSLTSSYTASGTGTGYCSTPGCNAETGLGGTGIPAGPLRLNGYSPIVAQVNSAFTSKPLVGGGTGPYSYVYTGTLPAGLTFDAQGWVTGTAPAAPAQYTISVTVTDSLLATSTKSITLTFVSNSVPSVTAVSVLTDTTNGGASTIITGTNFDASATVSIGGNDATVTATSGSTSITVTVPARATAGTFSLIVSNPGPVSSNATDFTYTAASAPTITGLSPTWGSTSGGTSITVTGTGFSPAPNKTSFKLGTTVCTVGAVTSTSLTCSSSAAAAGAVTATATNPDTKTGTLSNAFVYVSRTIVDSADGGSVALSGTTTTSVISPSDITANSVNVLLQPSCANPNQGKAARAGGSGTDKQKITYDAPSCAGATGPVVVEYQDAANAWHIVTFTVTP